VISGIKMKAKRGGIMLNKMGRFRCLCRVLGLFLFIVQITVVNASDLAISGLNISTLAGDSLQIQLEMNGAAIEPKVFHTDNPARIALDFSEVKNALDKKTYAINQGPVTSLYIAEAANRVRIVVNLLEPTPFTTKVIGNKVLLTLNRTKSDNTRLTPKALPISEKQQVKDLIPQQSISGFDFKRGDKGEGRLLVYLANPNTLANTKVDAGKVIINLTNTHLPENLTKRLDVSEFGTPIKFIDTISTHQNTQITVSTLNELYEYSLFQSEGLLTIEFRPLSPEEKEALDRSRVKYTGERLSLNFQDIEIRSVIAILAEFTKQNIVAGDDVTGNITLKLDDVPWDEALDFIMMTKELGKFESGNVTLISPLDKIKDYKKKQQETAAVVEQIDPLITEYIKIDYTKAENIRNVLNGRDTGIFGSCGAPQLATQGGIGAMGQSGQTGAMVGMGQSTMGSTAAIGQAGSGTQEKNTGFGFLSARGSTVVDTRTNTLIVRETTKRLEDIKKLIHKLDIPVRQVMIEARVAIASTNFTQNLGVKFGAAKTKSNPFAIGGTLTSTNQNPGITAANNNLLVDLGAAAIAGSPPAALGMTLARGADYVLNLELQALQADGKAEILSNPRVMTMDRCTATMMQGVEIPVTTPAALGSPPTTTYTPAVLELDVNPQITPSGSVIMNLLVKKDSQNTTTNPVSGNPGIDTRQVKTSVLVEDGETVVLGGVYENQNSSGKNKIPFFADLPGIGFLFTNSTINKVNTELLIFITPKIIKNNVETN
jgi:type IV pilus assembly protein PilQ